MKLNVNIINNTCMFLVIAKTLNPIPMIVTGLIIVMLNIQFSIIIEYQSKTQKQK